MGTKPIVIENSSPASVFASQIQVTNTATSTSETDGAVQVAGGISTQENLSIGKNLNIKGGANGRIGTGILAGGFATIANNSITANSRIFITLDITGGGVMGDVGEEFDDRVVGTSFTIRSSNLLDNRRFAYFIIEQI